MYYLMQSYTSYSEFAKIYINVKGGIWNLLSKLAGEISRQLLPNQQESAVLCSQTLVPFPVSATHDDYFPVPWSQEATGSDQTDAWPHHPCAIAVANVLCQFD